MSRQLERFTLDNRIEMERILRTDGVRQVLRFLNQRAGFRYTALYVFQGERLENHVLVDQQDPEATTFADLPVLASYCVFVRATGAPFRVDDAHTDARVAGHPKRLEIRSYCGVPLVDEFGAMYGTICHFDTRPTTIADSDVALLEAMAPLLRKRGAL